MLEILLTATLRTAGAAIAIGSVVAYIWFVFLICERIEKRFGLLAQIMWGFFAINWPVAFALTISERYF